MYRILKKVEKGQTWFYPQKKGWFGWKPASDLEAHQRFTTETGARIFFDTDESLKKQKTIPLVGDNLDRITIISYKKNT